ncbi:patatin-like phospholipase family protein [Egicoccus halophilus]|uniref:Membrane protein n=1 Tax=Egicoccus halophilus TaxID=1670830 RepID=A0A8J3EUK6_9ACTN|nr:patatin-like phospholipase family protein [Egicoccus halophilus]GGI07391.1 membrane protein [Egicoccus halophilus]
MRSDLVLEGGGAKGVALAGAVAGLAAHGIRFERIAGTSAGAIVAALLAAGMPAQELDRLARELDLRALVPAGPLDRLGRVGQGLRGLSVLLELGIFDHRPLMAWLRERLAALGVETFGDLRREVDGDDVSGRRQYRLVLAAADITRGRRVLLPWDYDEYGLDPDAQPVVPAVAASAAIPLVFEPVRLPFPDTDDTAVLVDGALLSNFPVDVFDRTDGAPPRWPTIGVKLTARPEGPAEIVTPVTGPVSYLRAVIGTAVTAWDQRHLDDPRVVARTVFVDTTGYPSLDFDLTPVQRAALADRGHAAAAAWLGARP